MGAEQHIQHYRVGYRANQDPRFEFPPSRSRTIHDPTHDRIGYRIEDPRHQKQDADHPNRQSNNIGVVIHQIHVDDTDSEIFTKGTKSVAELCCH